MNERSRRQFLRASGTLAALSTIGFSGRTAAQPAPLDNVRIVTGFTPGGTSDTLCRRVAEGLKGTPYAKAAIVENKPGAGGQIGVQAMKGAATDGSVLLQTPASMLVIYPHTYKSLAYNPFIDVTPVSLGCAFDFGFCDGPAVPDHIKDIPGFFTWAKANPNRANYASAAAGSMPHFIGVSGLRRSRFAPGVPTFVEQGFKDLAFSEWFGFFAPAVRRPMSWAEPT